MKATSFLLRIAVILAAYEVHQASSIASRDFLNTLNLKNCDDFNKRLLCAQLPYRTFDGTCNNLCNINRGGIFQPLERLDTLKKPTAYEPGFKPRRSVTGKELPNARRVSVGAFRSDNGNINGAPDFTHLVMTWGQFLDHDITLTEMEEAECGSNVKPCPQRRGCIGIDILKGNELGIDKTFQCIPLRRSFQNKLGDQINIITSYIDASNVYGSTKELANRLRAKGGLLDVRFFTTSRDQPVLPPDDETFCRSVNREEEPCFLAGDVRANENHALTTMHVVWVREHNRIVTVLRTLNPHWSEEKLFQEARKIVGAEMQHITYNEWLPVFFNKRVLQREGLLLEPKGKFYTLYDPTVSSQMLNSFSTAALRMGHTLVRNRFDLRDENFRRGGFGRTGFAIPTADFYIPAPFFEEGNNPFGGILLGLVLFRAQQIDRVFVDAIRERLNFEGPEFNGTFGDLPAINIQRGRDHGLPGYVKYREACGGKPAKSFDDLADTIRLDDRNRLKQIYNGKVEDLDLFPAGIVEIPVEGSTFGFTFTCILTRQFNRSRRGDRFWYERESAFTLAQLNEIRKARISRIICDNADGVSRIQRDGFRPATSGGNPRVFCQDLDFVDLLAFKEDSGESDGAVEGGEPNAYVGA